MVSARPEARRLVRLAGVLLALWLSGCQTTPNHHLIYPASVPPSVTHWQEQIVRGDMLIRMEWARPDGTGPFPTVLVHPEGGKTAEKMRGVIWDLASRGYVAVAADYQRWLDGDYRPNTFSWRSEANTLALLKYVRKSPWVDTAHIGLLGFSQGGVYSLLIAAHAPQQIKTVVAYYVVSDFEYWLDKQRPGFGRQAAYQIIRHHFYKESGARSDGEFSYMLSEASAMKHAQQVQAPVLLIHGDSDTAAEVDESQRLAARLKKLGKTVKLIVIPGGVHIFNFRQEKQGRQAWGPTIEWLDKYLKPRQ